MKKDKVAFYLFVVMIAALVFFCTIVMLSDLVYYTYTFDELIHNGFYIMIVGITGVSVLNYIITKKIVTFKSKLEYNRDHENSLSPLESEILIDGKADFKNSILSCFIDLIDRKNIENIDNKKLNLLSKEGLNNNEKDIVEFVFGENDFVDLKELSNRVKDNPKEAYSWFINLKSKIIYDLFQKGFYSKKVKKVVKLLSIFQKGVYAYLILLLLLFSNGDLRNYEDSSMSSFVAVIAILIISFVLCIPIITKGIDKMDVGYIVNENNKQTKFKMYFKLLYLLILWIYLTIDLYLCNFSVFIAIPFIVGIVINELYLRFDNRNVLTDLGKEEYRKIYGLKKYVEEYSIMEEKDVDSVIIWNRYLSYAIAFGLSDKVLKKIDKTGWASSMVIDTLEL